MGRSVVNVQLAVVPARVRRRPRGWDPGQDVMARRMGERSPARMDAQAAE